MKLSPKFEHVEGEGRHEEDTESSFDMTSKNDEIELAFTGTMSTDSNDLESEVESTYSVSTFIKVMSCTNLSSISDCENLCADIAEDQPLPVECTRNKIDKTAIAERQKKLKENWASKNSTSTKIPVMEQHLFLNRSSSSDSMKSFEPDTKYQMSDENCENKVLNFEQSTNKDGFETEKKRHEHDCQNLGGEENSEHETYKGTYFKRDSNIDNSKTSEKPQCNQDCQPPNVCPCNTSKSSKTEITPNFNDKIPAQLTSVKTEHDKMCESKQTKNTTVDSKRKFFEEQIISHIFGIKNNADNDKHSKENFENQMTSGAYFRNTVDSYQKFSTEDIPSMTFKTKLTRMEAHLPVEKPVSETINKNFEILSQHSQNDCGYLSSGNEPWAEKCEKQKPTLNNSAIGNASVLDANVLEKYKQKLEKIRLLREASAKRQQQIANLERKHAYNYESVIDRKLKTLSSLEDSNLDSCSTDSENSSKVGKCLSADNTNQRHFDNQNAQTIRRFSFNFKQHDYHDTFSFLTDPYESKNWNEIQVKSHKKSCMRSQSFSDFSSYEGYYNNYENFRKRYSNDFYEVVF